MNSLVTRLSFKSLSPEEVEREILNGQSLSNKNLEGINLSHKDLTGVDLSGSILIGANLSHANLSNANLEGADFTHVQGLSEENRAYLCSRSAQELGKWNPFTRSNTAQSLGCNL